LEWEFDSLRAHQRFIVNSWSNSFDQLRQKQGSEMQEYITGESPVGKRIMESNAAGLVLRPALKTGFSEMGWGSTPLLSAKFRLGSAKQN
jgi:hypothetical protein